MERYRKTSLSYCESYFGGKGEKIQQCEPTSACPQWGEWGGWSGCGKPSNKTINCRRKRSTLAAANSTSFAISASILYPNISVGFILLPPLKYQDIYEIFENRSRTCVTKAGVNNVCSGNSTEYRIIKCPFYNMTSDCESRSMDPDTNTTTPNSATTNTLAWFTTVSTVLSRVSKAR